MFEKGKSTPEQREQIEKGFPVSIWFVAILAVLAIGIIFGPSLMTGTVSSSSRGEDVDIHTGDGNSVTGATETEDDSSDMAEGKEYKLGERGLYATGAVNKDGIATIYIENRHNFQIPFPRLDVRIGVVLTDGGEGEVIVGLYEADEYIYPGKIKTVKINTFDLPEMIYATKDNVREIKINRISLQ